MKVLLINGSPNEKRCTHTALAEVAGALEARGRGDRDRMDRTRCRARLPRLRRLRKRGDARCIFDDDVVNGLIERREAADGLVVGSPVFYAGANGACCRARPPVLRRLVAAALQARGRRRFRPSRRHEPAVDQVNKYFQICCMPVVSSNYWPIVHGKAADRCAGRRGHADHARAGHEHGLDAEGDSRGAGAEVEQKVMTNFIR